MENTDSESQLASLEWLTFRDDPQRIKQNLSKPDEIGSKIINLVEQLNSQAVHAYNVEGIVTNQVVAGKQKLLKEFIEESKEELDKNEIFLYLGGSLLYQDPSENPDYDLVAFTFKNFEGKRNIVNRLENDLYEKDTNVHIIDLVPVDLERFSQLAERLQAGDYTKPNDLFTRTDLHYLAHVLTAYPVFIPSKYDKHVSEDLKNYLITHYYQKVPLLGALCIIDLENALQHREDKKKTVEREPAFVPKK